MKALRRLRAKKPLTVARAGDAGRRAGPEGIGHRERRGGALRMGQRGDHRVDHRAGHAGPRHVVDQHHIGAVPGQRLEAAAHAFGPRFAAVDQPHVERRSLGAVFRVNHQRPRGNIGPVKGRQRPVDNAPASQRAPLFRRAGPCAGAAPGGNNQSCDFHGRLIRPAEANGNCPREAARFLGSRPFRSRRKCGKD